MKRLACVLSFISLLPPACTVEQLPLGADSTPQLSTVEGHVVDSSGTGQPAVTVHLSGTDFLTCTDTSGRFVLHGVPSGSYTLVAGDTTVDLDITAPDTQVVDRIVVVAPDTQANAVPSNLHLTGFQISYTSYGIEDAFSRDAADLRMNKPVYLDADTLRIRFTVNELTYKSSSAGYVPAERRVTIARNDTTVYDTVAPKGRVCTTPVIPSGLDTFTIAVDGYTYSRFLVVSRVAKPTPTAEHFLVTTQRVELQPHEYGSGNFGSSPKVVVGPDTFRLSYEEYSPVDWDLYVVNDSTGDTCYWHNRNPDWGLSGTAHDDPLFTGDNVSTTYTDQTVSDFYLADRIQITSAPAGTFSVYVAYHDGPGDSTTATPELNIELGRVGDGTQIAAFYQNKPDRGLRKGEVWHAGTITLPGRRYDPSTQTIEPAQPGISKQRSRTTSAEDS